MLLVAGSVVSVSAQYGSSNGGGSATDNYPTEPTSSNTAVSGSTNDVINGALLAGVTEFTITLQDNVTGATINSFVVNASSLPDTLPVGDPLGLYNFDFSGVNKEDVQFTFTFKVPTSEANTFDEVKVYVYNSPAVEIPVTSLGTSGGDSLYQVTTAGVDAIAVMGSNAGDSGLIRTGGRVVNSALPYLIIGLFGFSLFKVFSGTKKAKSKIYNK